MVLWRTLAAALICLPTATLCASARAAQNAPAANSSANSTSSATPANGVSIAVADFSGSDKELGRFLADTLLTDLSQSERLRMVERAEIGKALTELKLQSTGLAEPQDVKKVGKLLGADRLIVGSYLVRDNQLLINARLLDVRTGRVTPGGGANVTGNRDGVLLLVHQLAHRFHKRVTGAELLLENERSAGAVPVLPIESNPNDTADNRDTHVRVLPERSAGNDRYNVRQPEDNSNNASAPAYVPSPSTVNYNGNVNTNVPPLFSLPSGVSPLRAVTSSDMTRLLARSGGRSAFFTPGRADLPVSRLRALVALVKAGGFSAPIAADPGALATLLPDAQAVPLWATGYLVTAVRQGLWPSTRPFHPADTANWGFLSAVVGRVNAANRVAPQEPMKNLAKNRQKSAPTIVVHARITLDSRASSTPSPSRWGAASAERAETGRSDAAFAQSVYTGLLIEARDLPVLRSMSARIIDVEGQAVYPDPQYIPDVDYLQDHGMADYYHSGTDAPRAGNHPLIVRALNVVGDDIIVSMETASRIREAGRHDGFLRQWRVGILLDEGR